MNTQEKNEKLNFNSTLIHEKIELTVEKLTKRINERFPKSSIGKTSDDFLKFTENSENILLWILKPNLTIRVIAYTTISISILGILYCFKFVKLTISNSLEDISSIAESSINNFLLIGAAYFFLFKLENRIKRTRAIKYLNEIRGFVHVIDMHQLSMNPQYFLSNLPSTINSPVRNMNYEEFSRYLNYSSELVALCGKLAALFAQQLPDEVVVKSASDIENLCSNIINKISNKHIVLESMDINLNDH